MPDWRRIVGSIGHDDLTRSILQAAGLAPDTPGVEIVLATLAPTDDERIGVGLHFEVIVEAIDPAKGS